MQAREILKQELHSFNNVLTKEFQSEVTSVHRMMMYLSQAKGKQLRPIFLLLCARLCGATNDRTYRAAALIEMLHIASLVHDDIVDHSMKRRGAYSANALWKSRSAVFLGDVLFTKGVLLPLENGDYNTLKIFAKAIEETIEGELVQLSKTQKLNLDENVYYNIIRQKTATLLRAACEAGAATTSEDNNIVQQLATFGENVGMAFQIKDDLLDYGTDNIGKPIGNDIQERKITLPLIHVLNKCDNITRRKLLYIIKHQSTNEKQLQYLKEQVKELDGFTYAESKMLEYRNNAMNILYSFAETPVRTALEELVVYITERKY
ncbi:polyprenyl synthetase family protein [Chitinophaga silvatica]|uniref:Polyprenyl synthetase family protein n=1 Tax=Chitinophaga silvatica TaxID=2282649 RepID=A0A3E1YD38_9BACT|nr:polyprenyl synthetase family protein [Chitinophaga silvatica]RFS23934.1 polyprenyl synthetase family protein [Chitinophaga silvatica]